jgi:alpha-L-fucosidase
MRFNEAYRNDNRNFDNYLDYMHGQIRELCTDYGKIDIFWFDFSYGELSGEAWRATELVNMIREHQPHVIMDNRLEASGEGFGSLLTDNPTAYSGDFLSPEQIIPPKGITSDSGKPVCWEACITMNNNWGYAEFDHEFKSSSTCIRKLVECVSKNGNMLLNVGPDARGRIPTRSVEILSDIGEWMRQNGESVYGCAAADIGDVHGLRFTAKGKHIYIHVTEQTIGPVAVKGIAPGDVKSCRLLSTGAELALANTWATANYPGYTFIALGPEPLHTYALPDERDTVIDIELK